MLWAEVCGIQNIGRAQRDRVSKPWRFPTLGKSSRKLGVVEEMGGVSHFLRGGGAGSSEIVSRVRRVSGNWPYVEHIKIRPRPAFFSSI